MAVPSTTLYAHANLDGDFWLSTVKEDEAGDDDVVTIASTGDVQCDGGASFALLPALGSLVVLDTTKDILFNVRFGVGSGAYEGTVTTTLTLGETQLATASQDVGPTASASGVPAGYIDVNMVAKAASGDLAPGKDLVWTISFSGICTSAFLQTGQGGNYCNLVLPIASVASPGGNATGNLTGNTTTSNSRSASTTAASRSSTRTNSTSATNTTSGAGDKKAPVAPMVLAAPLAAAALVRRRKPLPP